MIYERTHQQYFDKIRKLEKRVDKLEEKKEEIPDELTKLFVRIFAKTEGWENITIKDILDVI